MKIADKLPPQRTHEPQRQPEPQADPIKDIQERLKKCSDELEEICKKVGHDYGLRGCQRETTQCVIALIDTVIDITNTIDSVRRK